MKKYISIILAFCLCFTVALPSFAESGSITVDGSWHIAIPSDASAYEAIASDTLKSELSKVFDADIAVNSESGGSCIVLDSVIPAEGSGIENNGYRIKADGGRVLITGAGPRGLQAGICRFLEEFCGRKVYTRDLTVLPKAESVSVPADTDILYAPFFEYTETDWKSPGDWTYSMANGLNGGTGRKIAPDLGGAVYYLGGFCHTMGGLCETEAHKDSDPEQLALHDGERTTDQPCLTNPDVLEIATRNVLKILEERYDPQEPVQIVSVTQNDNYNYCECERCKAFEDAHGGVQSATMINFVNQIADAVREAGYVNAAIDTFAYQYTRQAPTGIVPRDNVIVRLCTIECCFCHPLDDVTCERNVELMKDLRDWSAICDRIYVWDYTNNYSNTCIIFPDFGVIQRNIRVFYENNVIGVYEEGNYYMYNCDAEFGELRSYMISKSLQDPYCDLDAEVDGFLEAFYGPGWENIRQIIDMHVENAGAAPGAHVGIGESPSASFHLTDRQILIIDDLWEDAKKEAETEKQLENIERSELCWRFWKGSVNKDEFSLMNPDRYKEKQKLFDDMKASGITMINEGGYDDYLDCLCVKYVPVNEWNMYEADERDAQVRLFFGKILESITPLLAAFGIYYRIARSVGNFAC